MKKSIACLFIILIAISAFQVSAAQTGSTNFTVTKSINQNYEISQDAFLPSAVYNNLGISNAQDMFVYNQKIYIADTDNKRIIVVDIESGEAFSFGEALLESPRGVSADDKGRIYVADYGKNAAYRFNSRGEVEQSFEKPETPAFGKHTRFQPSKIAPADDGGVFLISEGSLAGIIHMSAHGEFLGFFASNDVYKTPLDRLLDVILTAEQQSRFLPKTPPSFGNIFKGTDGMVYTINKDAGSRIKKHSISGSDMLSKNGQVPAVTNAGDIAVAKDGRMLVVDGGGRITEITPEGYLLCSFGGQSAGEDRAGLFDVPSGIGEDDAGNIYVLDQKRNYIQIFRPTAAQKRLHSAISDYNAGNYEKSKKTLLEILKFNNTSFLAHVYIGKCLMSEGDYSAAAAHFKTAQAKEDYSEAFHELRSRWLQKNMMNILIALIILAVLIIIFKRLLKAKKALEIRHFIGRAAAKSSFISDLRFLKYAVRHPVDNSYEVKISRRGSFYSATAIYLLLFALYVLFNTASGFLFSVNLSRYSVVMTFLYFSVFLALFLIGSYFISSINDGNGTFKALYITTAYSFAPAIFILPVLTVLTNFLTYNEGFLIETALTVAAGWCFVNIILSLIEIHRYRMIDIIKNLLLTAFFMAVAVLTLSFGYLLIKQIVDFFRQVFTEVTMRG